MDCERWCFVLELLFCRERARVFLVVSFVSVRIVRLCAMEYGELQNGGYSHNGK